MYRWIGGIAVALVLSGLGVGCGGGSDGPEITKAEFVKKADLICAEYKGKRLAAAEKRYNPMQRQELAAERNGTIPVGGKAAEERAAKKLELAEELLTKKIIPLTRTEQEKLEALGLPAGNEDEVEAMFANLDKAIGEIEKEGFKGLVGGNQFDQFEKEAEEYGLNCKVI